MRAFINVLKIVEENEKNENEKDGEQLFLMIDK